MVRKQNRKEINLKLEATHSFKNKNEVVCFGLKTIDDFFALSPERDKWVRIPKWAFNKYFTGGK